MEQTTIRDTVAAEVRAALGRANMNAAELARETGISKPAMSRKLAGTTSFTTEELIGVARAVGASVESLIGPAIPAEVA